MKYIITRMITVMVILIIIINAIALCIDNVVLMCVAITLATIGYAFYAREAETLITKWVDEYNERARVSEQEDKDKLMIDRHNTINSHKDIAEQLLRDNDVSINERGDTVFTPKSKVDDDIDFFNKRSISNDNNDAQYDKEHDDYVNLITNNKEFDKVHKLLINSYDDLNAEGNITDFIVDMSVTVGYPYRKSCVDWLDYSTRS